MIRAYRESALDAVAAIHSIAYPKTRMYVAESDAGVIGFAMWTEKSGFCAQAVLELEQIAVAAVVVTTRADNAAQKLYRKTLGAEVEATIASLYSGDEVLMVARLR